MLNELSKTKELYCSFYINLIHSPEIIDVTLIVAWLTVDKERI